MLFIFERYEVRTVPSHIWHVHLSPNEDVAARRTLWNRIQTVLTIGTSKAYLVVISGGNLPDYTRRGRFLSLTAGVPGGGCPFFFCKFNNAVRQLLNSIKGSTPYIIDIT